MKLRYLLIVKYILKPETSEKFAELLKKMNMEEICANEQGCILYKYSAIKDNILELQEIWTDREHQQSHMRSEHITQLDRLKQEYVLDTIIEEHTVYLPDEILDSHRRGNPNQSSSKIKIEEENKAKNQAIEETNNKTENEISNELGNGIKEKIENEIKNEISNLSASVTVDATVTVPGSKSMTNRALLLAALSEGETTLSGVLFSDDSRHFLASLECLGFDMDIDENGKTVKIRGTGGNIPHKTGTIDVGSAGTAARFLTAMLALSDGEYTINCSEQMERRPMKPLFDVLESMGAEFTYLNREGFLPVKVKGKEVNHSQHNENTITVSMDISKSTQFLSAMLMVAPVMGYDLNIKITSEKKTGAYIHITMEMLKGFGVNIDFTEGEYRIRGGQKIRTGNYTIEPDVSAACYFFAAAAITGGRVMVKNIFYKSMQGDMKFLDVIWALGCEVRETAEGMEVTGPKDGRYNGIDVDMNNFSDQALTLAVVAAFANTETTIRNVGHIRGQECDRMAAIMNELGKCGIEADEEGDNIVIHPGNAHGALIDTYDDHRVAMSFNLMSLRTKGIIIDNPMCCRKTFENYYEVFEGMFTASFS